MDSSLLRVGLQVYAWIIWAMLTLLSSGNVDRTSWLHLFFPLPQALENEGTCALTVWRSTFEQESYLQSLLEDTSCFPFRREGPFSPASLLKVFCPRLTKDVRNTHPLCTPIYRLEPESEILMIRCTPVGPLSIASLFGGRVTPTSLRWVFWIWRPRCYYNSWPCVLWLCL